MEFSAAACVSRLPHPPSFLFSPFSDQSHVDFYRCSAPLPALRLRLPPSRVFTHVTSVPPLCALCDRAVVEPPLPQEPSLLVQELAQLKMQMKQKKKELKAQKKEEKKKLKMQLNEEKKGRKQKDLPEGQRPKMKKCSSKTSSSSSESSDDDCESLSMRMLRRERTKADRSEDAVVQNVLVERDWGAPAKVKVADPMSCVESSLSRLNEDATELAADIVPVLEGSLIDVCNLFENEVSLNGNGATEKSSQSILQTQRSLLSARNSPSIFPSARCSNRIEVCAGGKCKKAGSEHLLSALRANIPNSLDVEAVPCKCMGKCSMAMNVKVHKEDTNPQHHSHVRVEDANLILSHHFGLGRPPTGLPSISLDERTRQPLPLGAPACVV